MVRMRGACLLLVLAAACGPLVRRPALMPQPSSALVEVGTNPPPARVEIVPPEPSSTAVWMDGEWIWRRAQWAWLPGRWVEPPPGAQFASWVFERGSDGRLWYAPGEWRRPDGTAVDPPQALAIAAVESGVVVTADGTTETTGPTLRNRPKPASSSR
jgi:hypothetical protein